MKFNFFNFDELVIIHETVKATMENMEAFNDLDSGEEKKYYNDLSDLEMKLREHLNSISMEDKDGKRILF